MKKLILTFIVFYFGLLSIFANNQIVISGLNNKDSFEDIINFFADYWKIDSVNFVVIFQQFPAHGHRGSAEYQEIPEHKLKNAVIKIDKNLDFNTLRMTLIHELIHIKQFYYKELIKMDTKHYCWKEKDFPNIKAVSYKNRPWEQEALSNEKRLYLLYLKAKKEEKIIAKKKATIKNGR